MSTSIVGPNESSLKRRRRATTANPYPDRTRLTVAAHDQRLLGPVLVEERRAERGGVTRPELEDMAELDRRLDDEASAAVRARVVPLCRADVGELGLVVSAGFNAAEMPAVAVRTR